MSASFNFEVYGKVQGVFFRAHTAENAHRLGAVGWVANTSKGTVTGVIQGDRKAVEGMKVYLKEQGSPASRIEKCEIQEERELTKPEFSGFEVR